MQVSTPSSPVGGVFTPTGARTYAEMMPHRVEIVQAQTAASLVTMKSWSSTLEKLAGLQSKVGDINKLMRDTKKDRQSVANPDGIEAFLTTSRITEDAVAELMSFTTTLLDDINEKIVKPCSQIYRVSQNDRRSQEPKFIERVSSMKSAEDSIDSLRLECLKELANLKNAQNIREVEEASGPTSPKVAKADKVEKSQRDKTYKVFLKYCRALKNARKDQACHSKVHIPEFLYYQEDKERQRLEFMKAYCYDLYYMVKRFSGNVSRVQLQVEVALQTLDVDKAIDSVLQKWEMQYSRPHVQLPLPYGLPCAPMDLLEQRYATVTDADGAAVPELEDSHLYLSISDLSVIKTLHKSNAVDFTTVPSDVREKSDNAVFQSASIRKSHNNRSGPGFSFDSRSLSASTSKRMNQSGDMDSTSINTKPPSLASLYLTPTLASDVFCPSPKAQTETPVPVLVMAPSPRTSGALETSIAEEPADLTVQEPVRVRPSLPSGPPPRLRPTSVASEIESESSNPPHPTFPPPQVPHQPSSSGIVHNGPPVSLPPPMPSSSGNVPNNEPPLIVTVTGPPMTLPPPMPMMPPPISPVNADMDSTTPSALPTSPMIPPPASHLSIGPPPFVRSNDPFSAPHHHGQPTNPFDDDDDDYHQPQQQQQQQQPQQLQPFEKDEKDDSIPPQIVGSPPPFPKHLRTKSMLEMTSVTPVEDISRKEDENPILSIPIKTAEPVKTVESVPETNDLNNAPKSNTATEILPIERNTECIIPQVAQILHVSAPPVLVAEVQEVPPVIVQTLPRASISSESDISAKNSSRDSMPMLPPRLSLADLPPTPEAEGNSQAPTPVHRATNADRPLPPPPTVRLGQDTPQSNPSSSPPTPVVFSSTQALPPAFFPHTMLEAPPGIHEERASQPVPMVQEVDPLPIPSPTPAPAPLGRPPPPRRSSTIPIQHHHAKMAVALQPQADLNSQSEMFSTPAASVVVNTPPASAIPVRPARPLR